MQPKPPAFSLYFEEGSSGRPKLDLLKQQHFPLLSSFFFQIRYLLLTCEKAAAEATRERQIATFMVDMATSNREEQEE
jgi:hypothetical protein